MAKEIRNNKVRSKQCMKHLMNEERRLKELEYKIPFIYECMGNTIYGNKHMELKDLEFTIREKEHDVEKMEEGLKSLRFEAQQDDLFQEYHQLSLKQLRRENEIVDEEMKEMAEKIAKK